MKANSKVKKVAKKSTTIKIIDIHNVIRQGKISCVKRAIANKQNLNLPEDISKYGESEDDFTKLKAYCPLTLAILQGKTDIASELIKAKVDLNIKPEDTTQYTPNCLTPLASCVIKRNYKVMKELLDAGAKPDEFSWMYGRTFDYDNHIEYTPLMIAVERKDVLAIEILLKGGADKNCTDYDLGVYDIAVHPDNYNEYIFKNILGFEKKDE